MNLTTKLALITGAVILAVNTSPPPPENYHPAKIFGQANDIIDEPDTTEITPNIVSRDEPSATAELASIPILFVLMIVGTLVAVVAVSVGIILVVRRRNSQETDKE